MSIFSPVNRVMKQKPFSNPPIPQNKYQQKQIPSTSYQSVISYTFMGGE